MNRAHQIRRMAKRIAEYGIEDLSIHDVDKFHDLIFAEKKERWDRALSSYGGLDSLSFYEGAVDLSDVGEVKP